MPQAAHFTPALFRFLSDLRRNNRRDWFDDHRECYERNVRGPCLQFIADFAAPLRKMSPHLVADPRPVGGSLFRIHRDTRFAKDKSPYKTNVGAHFRHAVGRDAHAPGFYLHLEPGQCFAGAGVWHPDGGALTRVRDAIVEDPRGWKRVVAPSRLGAAWRLSGDGLVRPPRGYDADHPLIEDLKRKDFVCVTPLTEAEVCAPGFLRAYAVRCRAVVPFLRFLAGALELEL